MLKQLVDIKLSIIEINLNIFFSSHLVFFSSQPPTNGQSFEWVFAMPIQIYKLKGKWQSNAEQPK